MGVMVLGLAIIAMIMGTTIRGMAMEMLTICAYTHDILQLAELRVRVVDHDVVGLGSRLRDYPERRLEREHIRKQLVDGRELPQQRFRRLLPNHVHLWGNDGLMFCNIDVGE